MKMIKVIATTCLAIMLALQSEKVNSQGTPVPFIYEIHPHTLYLVTLEYDKTINNFDFYKPITATPESSRNICQVKPEACYRPSDIEPPPGVEIIE